MKEGILLLQTALISRTDAIEELQEDLEKLEPNAVLKTLESWAPSIFAFCVRLLIAAVIIFITVRIARFVSSLLAKTFKRAGIDEGLGKFLLAAVRVVIYVLGIFIAADQIGIPSASIIALLGSAGLAIGLALQGSLENVAGGILILFMHPFNVNDYIVYGGIEGTVESIGLVYTTILTVDNKMITVPNGAISNATVTNVTALKKRRVDVFVGISYRADIKKAKAVMEQVYRDNPAVLPEEGITVFVNELADSAVVIGGRGWVKTDDYWTTLWAVTEGVKEAYDANGIEIPFNQIDVHMIGQEK